MSAQLHASGVPLADGSPARKLLEQIARVYAMVLVADPKGRVEWFSEPSLEDCGKSLRDFAGRDLRDAIPKLPRPEQSFPILNAMRERGFVVRACVETLDTEGAPAELDLSILPLRCASGGEFNVVLARRAPGDEGPAAEVRAALEAIPDGLLQVDPRGFVSYANRATQRLLGFAPEELEGAALAVLAADGLALGRLLQALDEEEPAEVEVELRTAGAAPRSVSVSLARRPGATGWTLSLRAAPETSSDLMRRNDELEHCVNALAHDLRSPLVALLGFSRLLRQDYGERLDDTGAHFIDRIEQAGRTMEALIHDLLELSRIGQPGEHPAMVDPRAVLIQLAAELKPRLDAEGIRLFLPSNPPLVYCDRTRLYQVFSNLIGNAVEHMGDGDERRIDIEVAESSGFHRITVRDTGRGIDPEHHERIFEAFQSLGSRRDGRKGTGMGLAIVRKIADTRGGRAWVESDRGAGAVFHVTLPIR